MTRPAARIIEVSVNGEAVTASAPDRKLLCDFLREDLSLTGTHVGASTGFAVPARCMSMAGRCGPA